MLEKAKTFFQNALTLLQDAILAMLDQKKPRLALIGLIVFVITLLITLLLLPPSIQTPVPVAETNGALSLVTERLRVENSAFDSNLIEIPKDSVLRLSIFNMDPNTVHKFVLLQASYDNEYSIIDRLSIRPGLPETITIIGHTQRDFSYSGPIIRDELYISCTTCISQSTAKIKPEQD